MQSSSKRRNSPTAVDKYEYQQQPLKKWNFKKAPPSVLQRWRILFCVTLWGSFGAVFLFDVRSLISVGPTGTHIARPWTSPPTQSASSRNALADLDDDEFGGGSILDSIKALDESERRGAVDITDEELVILQRRARQLKVQHERGVRAGMAKGHAPVLLYTAMEFLFPKGTEQPDQRYSGTYVDCTFGRGGYSEQILARLSDSARLFAFDVDPTAIALGRQLENKDSRFHIFHRPFAEMGKALHGEDIHGIVLDIGISSPQLDNKERGFSLQNLAVRDGPLDLRMNADAGESAPQWLQKTSVEELAWVLYHYGPNECNSLLAERVAQAIMDDQAANGPFTLMGRFAEVIGRTLFHLTQDNTFEHPVSGIDHPAKLFLQAIRLYLNQEIEQLVSGLPQAFDLLVPGGRCLANAFKKMESDAIQEFVINHQEPAEDTLARIKGKRRLRELYPLLGTDLNYTVLLLGAPVKASGYEVNKNRRARSGSLSVMEKGPRRMRRIKAKPRLERSRFKQPPPRVIIGASTEDASDINP